MLNEDKKRYTFAFGGRRGGKSVGSNGNIVLTDKFILPEEFWNYYYSISNY